MMSASQHIRRTVAAVRSSPVSVVPNPDSRTRSSRFTVTVTRGVAPWHSGNRSIGLGAVGTAR